MRIFLTGASGFIGSRILPALQASGHQVIGLARSESTAQALKAAGAEVHRGTLDAPESLLAGVGNADAVIHTAFDHDFSRFAANCEKDRQAILALGQALRGSTRPLVITSGTLMGDDGSGAPARESFFNSAHPSPRTASELAGQQLLEAGVDVRKARWRISCATPCATRIRKFPSASRWIKTGLRLTSMTTARESARRIANRFSGHSTGPTRRATASPAAPAWGWRLSKPLFSSTAAG